MFEKYINKLMKCKKEILVKAIETLIDDYTEIWGWEEEEIECFFDGLIKGKSA